MDILQQFGFKDLESVVIKTTLPIEMDQRTILANETIAAFDKIQIANLQEIVRTVTAHGGYLDQDRVWWESEKSVDITFTQGIFSSYQLALMSNSKLFHVTQDTPIYLDERLICESDENGEIAFTDEIYDYIFVYRQEDGARIDDYVIDNEKISGLAPFKEYLINYAKKYQSDTQFVEIGSQLLNGFLTLQGRTRIKDDITGRVRTGIITIPKLKLMTGLSIRLGKNAPPTVGSLRATALPVGPKGNTKIIELAFLEDYIDSDI